MPPIRVIRTPGELRAWRSGAVAAGERLALVPTMGALHPGHLSLVEIARSRAEVALASLFVNPAQFAPNEDFAAYPRDEERDCALLAKAGCVAVYSPSAEAMYPPGFDTTITVGEIARPLEGAARPQHFAGVATVVAKLLLQVAPHVAVFGEKDFQQLQVIRRLALDLDLPIEIIGGPVIREPDGLALSSRNLYLSAAERAVAPNLFEVLSWAAGVLAQGGGDIEATEREAGRRLTAAGFVVDYIEVREATSLARFPPGQAVGDGRILAAARLGRTRLIDNVALTMRQAHAGA